jgi:hypothetical protein
MPDLSTLVKEAAQMLDASFEQESNAWFLTVNVSEGEDEDEDDRTQLVMVEPDDEGELTIVSTDVGPFNEEMDLAEVLRLMRDAVFCRVYVGEAGPDGGDEQVVIEAALVNDKLDAELLASVIQEVGEVADELELLLFDEEDEDAEEEEDEDDEDDDEA